MTQNKPMLNRGKKNENDRTENQENFLTWHTDYKIRMATSRAKKKGE